MADALAPREAGSRKTAPREDDRGDGYKWVALANTTASVFMATLDGTNIVVS